MFYNIFKAINITRIKLFLMVILIVNSLNCADKVRQIKIDRGGYDLYFPPPPDEPRIKFLFAIKSFSENKTTENFNSINPLIRPFTLYLDEPEKLFIVDQAIKNVVEINLNDNSYRLLDRSRSILSEPIAVAIDDKKFIYVDNSDGWIDVFNNESKYIRRINLKGKITRAAGLAFNPTNGLLYIIDVGEHNIKVLSHDGSLQKIIGRNGSGPAEFNYPTHIWIDKQGQLYISDTLNFRIQILDSNGNFIRSIGSVGDTPGHFSKLKGVATDSEGNIYAVDSYFDNVQIFDQYGRILLVFGTSGNEYGKFWLPNGIHISKDDRIFVADTYNGRIQVFQYIKTK